MPYATPSAPPTCPCARSARCCAWHRLRICVLYVGGRGRQPTAEPAWQVAVHEAFAHHGEHYGTYYKAERRHSTLGDHSPNHFETPFKATFHLCPA